MGDADLGRKLGTLRYLKGLQAARRRALAAATPDAPQPPLFTYSKGQPYFVPAAALLAAKHPQCSPLYLLFERFERVSTHQLLCILPLLYSSAEGEVLAVQMGRRRCARCARTRCRRSWRCCRAATHCATPAACALSIAALRCG